MPKRGMRSYLAVSGGINVPEMLGSRSTDLKAGFGGLEGRQLKEGDLLPAGKAAGAADYGYRRETAAVQQPDQGVDRAGI